VQLAIIEFLAEHGLNWAISFLILSFSLSLFMFYIIGAGFNNLFNTRSLQRASIQPVALNIGLGHLLVLAYIGLRSFFCSLSSVLPTYSTIEPFVLGLIIYIFSIRRDLKTKLNIKNTLITSVCYFLVILLSILLPGKLSYFDIYPPSTDPQLIGIWVDAFRNSGFFSSHISAFNHNVAAYPVGSIALYAAMLNPLLLTPSSVIIFPYYAVSILAFGVAELFLVHKSVPKKSVGLFIFIIFLVRIFIGSYDLSATWTFAEGVTKRHLFFFIPPVLWLMTQALSNGSAQKKMLKTLKVALAFFGVAFFTIVNQINFSISLTLGISLFTALLFIKHDTWWNRIKIASLSSVAAVLLAFVFLFQDTNFLKMSEGIRTSYCPLVDQKEHFCALTPKELEIFKTRSISPDVHKKIEEPFEVFLPDYIAKPYLLAWPDPQWVDLAEYGGVFTFCIVAFGFLCWMVRKKEAYQRNLAKVAKLVLLILLVFVIQYLAATLTTFLFQKTLSAGVKHLIKGYQNITYPNLWLFLWYTVICWATLEVLGSLAAKGSFGGIPIKGKLKTVLTLLIVAGFTGYVFNSLYYKNDVVFEKHKKKWWGKIGTNLIKDAKLVKSLHQAIRLNKGNIIGTGYYMQMGPEHWMFADKVTYMAQQYVSTNVFFSYLLIWPLVETDIEDFNNDFCLKRSCDYLYKAGFKSGDLMIGMAGETTMCLTEPFEPFLESMSCFEKIDRNVDKLIIYKLK
jgi:hypothetical protein